MMRWSPAFPAWISIALMGVCAFALWYVSQWPEDEPRWRFLSLAGHALALSSFVAAWITATTVWRFSRPVAIAHVVVAGIASYALWIASSAFGGGPNGHPVGVVIMAIIGFLFVPVSGLAVLIAVYKAEKAGFSQRTVLSGVFAGLIGILGALLYFPVASRVGDDLGVLAVWFTFNCLALAGWWIGTGAKAAASAA